MGIASVHAGERVVDPSLLSVLINGAVHRPAKSDEEPLSQRECHVLQLLAEGGTSKEIAATLGLKPKTVENHRARILDKLGVANSTAAVRIALGRGLVTSSGGNGMRVPSGTTNRSM